MKISHDVAGGGTWGGDRAAALGEYEAAPAPARKDEAWRFANLSALDLSEFVPAGAVSDEGRAIAASQGLAEVSAKMVFGNGRLLDVGKPMLPGGVIFTTLEAAALEHAALFEEFFMAQPAGLGSHKYAALHKARVSGGTFLYVPADTEVELPVEIFHWVEGDRASVYPHTLIVCGGNSRVTVVDRFQSIDGHRAFACGVSDLHLGAGAKLTYIAVQDWSHSSLALHLSSTTVGRRALSTALTANFGGGFVRSESMSRLVDEGARSEMYSINPMEGTREIDQRTLQDHVAPHATSDLLYLNALDGKSRSIFAGLIKVQPGAKGTDAYQKVKNLILSDDADPHSMPGLEILNDEVRCSHGATTGPVSLEELFYMQARGIRRDAGQRLLVHGFFSSLLEKIGDPKLRAHLGELLAKRLAIS